MTNKEKLELLNSLEIIESDGGEMPYVLVENSEENREILEKIGCKPLADEEHIDIFSIAFDLELADWFTGEKFIKLDGTEDYDHVIAFLNIVPQEYKKENNTNFYKKYMKMAEEACEKQNPRKMINTRGNSFVCPSCRELYDKLYDDCMKYCCKCGQRIDWSE